MNTPGNLPLLRSANQMAIVRAVRASPAISRAALATYVGLTKAGVGQLVESLIKDGWLAEQQAPTASARGRPSIPVILAGQRFAFLGVSVNEKGNRVFATTLGGEVIDSLAQIIPNLEVKAALSALALQISILHERLVAQGFKVFGVGVGAPGPVNVESGVLHYSDRAGWQDAAIRELLCIELAALKLSKLAVVVERGVGCIALHQFELKRTTAEEPLLYLQIGHSFAAAIAGRAGLSRGSRGLAGTVSHLQVVPDGAPCPCGRNGCANVTVTLQAIERSLGTKISGVEEIDITPAEVRAAVDQTGALLGLLIRNLCLVYDPARVFVGGPAPLVCPRLIEAAQETLDQLCSPQNMPTPSLEMIRSDNRDAVARGAAVALIDSVLGGRV